MRDESALNQRTLPAQLMRINDDKLYEFLIKIIFKNIAQTLGNLNKSEQCRKLNLEGRQDQYCTFGSRPLPKMDWFRNRHDGVCKSISHHKKTISHSKAGLHPSFRLLERNIGQTKKVVCEE